MSVLSIEKFVGQTVGSSDFQRKNLFRVSMFLGDIAGVIGNVLGGGALGNIAGGLAHNAGSSLDPLQYFVSSTSTPQETTNVLPFDWMSSQFKLAGRTTYSEWTVTVKDAQGGGLTPGGFIYQFFNAWRNFVYNRDGFIVGQYGVGIPLNEAGMGIQGHPGEYKKNIRLDLLKTTGSIAKSFELIGAWPTTIASSTFDYGTEGVQEFQVTFAYDWFKSIG